MWPKAIDSEAKRAREIIVLVKSNSLVKISRQNNFNPFFAAKKPAVFATGGL